jgi:serine protease AprX
MTKSQQKEAEHAAKVRRNARAHLFGDAKGRRFTQDSPVLPDVWFQYAKAPDERTGVLLTPFRGVAPGELAMEVHRRLDSAGQNAEAARIACNASVVAADLTLDELLICVLPLSPWWRKHCNAKAWDLFDRESRSSGRPGSPLEWVVRLYAGLRLGPTKDESPRPLSDKAARRVVSRFRDKAARPEEGKPLLWLVGRNRPATPAIRESVGTVKADAARRVFNIRCKGITWAILDTGIDARHPAFRVEEEGAPPPAPAGKAGARPSFPETRVIATYDFTGIRDLLRVDPPSADGGAAPAGGPAMDTFKAATLRRRILLGKDINWGELKAGLEVAHDETYKAPTDKHGTHVAGILGASFAWPPDAPGSPKPRLEGLCPDIRLIDLRVFSPEGLSDEFSILAALQFIRYLNGHNLERVVHGVNLSLSIPHDVSNFACGRTPVCDECARLIGDGIVVVAAAGNAGRRTYETADGPEDEYCDISITDPGNAEGVITVGATHRSSPHTYGVSFFSSRGPTGDGRAKPDLVAPGEKITAPVPGGDVDRLDGTSMAAPHVSGAAALLMATRPEFVGDPAGIKKILCETATDLGRERYFQGHGLVDILRAIQSI